MASNPPRRRPFASLIDPANRRPALEPEYKTPAVARKAKPILKTPLSRMPTPAAPPPHFGHLEPGHTPHSTPYGSDGTLRGLRVAFQETPGHLRELESGWRERRRERLSPRPKPITLAVEKGVRDGNRTCCKECDRTLASDDGAAGKEYGRLLSRGPPVSQPITKARLAENTVSGVFPSLPTPRRASLVAPPVRIDRVTDTLPRTGGTRNAHVRDTRPTSIPSGNQRPASLQEPIRDRLPLRRHPDSAPPSEQPRLGPIFAGTLPPTAYPLPIARTGHTITIHPNGSFSLTICSATRTIRVSQNGRQVRIDTLPSTSDNVRVRHRPNARNTQKAANKVTPPRETTLLDLDEVASWDDEKRSQWLDVQRMVQRHQRDTPHAKIYTSLGHLIINCSLPPDVILSFTYPYPSPLSGSNPGFHPPSGSSRHDVKARITLSRARSELRIDTASVISSRRVDGQAGVTAEKHRTSRTVALSKVGQGSRIRGLGLDVLGKGVGGSEEGATRELDVYAILRELGGVGGEANAAGATGEHALVGASAGAGRDTAREGDLARVRVEEWSEVEREAVGRLWDVRGEWRRFVDG